MWYSLASNDTSVETAQLMLWKHTTRCIQLNNVRHHNVPTLQASVQNTEDLYSPVENLFSTMKSLQPRFGLVMREHEYQS